MPYGAGCVHEIMNDGVSPGLLVAHGRKQHHRDTCSKVPCFLRRFDATPIFLSHFLCVSFGQRDRNPSPHLNPNALAKECGLGRRGALRHRLAREPVNKGVTHADHGTLIEGQMCAHNCRNHGGTKSHYLYGSLHLKMHAGLCPIHIASPPCQCE